MNKVQIAKGLCLRKMTWIERFERSMRDKEKLRSESFFVVFANIKILPDRFKISSFGKREFPFAHDFTLLVSLSHQISNFSSLHPLRS